MARVLQLVLDTNVLISAALSAQGVPAHLLRCVLQDHRLVFSQSTFDELHTRLYRPKFDRYLTLELRQRLLHDFNACAHWVELAPHGSYCRDPDDDKFFATAQQGGADCLVSGDSDVLDAPPLPGLRVVTPAQVRQLVLASGSSKA